VCPPVVNFEATGHDNCGEVTVTCTPASGSTFPLGTTTVTCTAEDGCGNPSEEPCTFTVTVNTSVCAVKFYDANANGENDDGQVVEGGRFDLSGDGSGSQNTDFDGKACFLGLPEGTYTVTEMELPNGWVAATPTFQTVTLGCPTPLNSATTAQCQAAAKRSASGATRMVRS
jgi:hypothetical protein